MNRNTHLLRLATLGIVSLATTNSFAANLAFDNTAGTLEWTTATNWSTDVLPGSADTADFRDGVLAGTGPFTINVGTAVGPIQNLRFGTGTAAANLLTKDITLNGGSITVTGTGAGTNGLNYNANSTAAVTINSDFVIAGDLEIAINAPASGSNFVTLNGVVSESGGSRVFKKTQNGKLVLSNAANSFTGGVLVQNGTLAVPTLSALGTGTTISLGNSTNTGAITGTLQYTGATDATLGRSIVTYTNGGTGGGIVESANAGVTLTLAAADSITGTGRFNFGGTGNVVVDSLVANTTNPVAKTGSGNGRLTNASNTYTGITLVRNGSLTVTAGGALGSSSGITLADGSSTATASPAFLTEGAFTVPQNITVNTIASGTGVTTIGGSTAQVAQSSAYAGSITLNRDLRLTSSTDAAHAVSFTGNIIDGAAVLNVTKVGTGTVILSGTNDYDGNTLVSEGRLLVNGVQSGTAGGFSVASGATLGGTGTIAGGITSDAGSTLAPGASIGSLTTGNATINGSLAVELSGTAAGSADVLNAQALTFGSTASLDFSTIAPLDDAAYVFATYATLDTSAFNPANITGLSAGYAVDFHYNGANQLAVIASVPEPGIAATAVMALTLVSRKRRR